MAEANEKDEMYLMRSHLEDDAVGIWLPGWANN